jgi:hypothetical protein
MLGYPADPPPDGGRLDRRGVTAVRETLVVLLFPVLAVAQTRSLTSFERSGAANRLHAENAAITVIDTNVTHGRRSLEIIFQPAEWPQVVIPAEWGWGLTADDGIWIDVTNPNDRPVEFGLRADDAVNAGPGHFRDGRIIIEPRTTATCILPIKAKPMDFGMRGLPGPTGTRLIPTGDSPPLDPGRVVSVRVFMHAPAAATRLIVDHLRAGPWHASLNKMVDEYGQYTGAGWPNKVNGPADLEQQRRAEAKELAEHPALPDRDEFGAWASGPTRAASGFFRTEQIDGRWWLVAPNGHLFLSMGMDCVTMKTPTIVTGREKCFSWLPGKNDPLGRHFTSVDNVHMGPIKSGEAFDFFSANLDRKYGSAYAKTWLDLSLGRLRSWGFNTVGNWSDHGLYGNQRVPYVVTYHIDGAHGRVSSGSDYWSRMHDPFDPAFAADASKAIAPLAERAKDDPWCLGYFVDNELSWGGWGDDDGRLGLAVGALSEPATSHAKKAFVEQLRGKYAAINVFNAAWGVQIADWKALDGPYRIAGKPNANARTDMLEFCRSFARKYFTVVRDTIRAHDPNHLYMGCRLAWRTPEAIEASAELCDVVSFNIYAKDVNAPWCRELTRLNKPCIIGEFHFGATDRGLFHPGLVAAADQRERADMYRRYVNSVVDHPAFVGCHWFQYVDQPLTGRSLDGENYNIGFLSVADVPYPEMVVAAREVHQSMYTRRSRPPSQ